MTETYPPPPLPALNPLIPLFIGRYGIESKTPPGKTNNVLFVDVGASHTTATVTSYFERAVSDYKNVSSVEILGVAHTLTGGSDLDRTMTEHFAKEFDEKHKKKIHEAPKAISKLRQQTEKIKVVLSANKETVMVIEGLMDDIDFKSRINRETMEKICEKTFTEIEETIKSAITKSGLKMEEIHNPNPNPNPNPNTRTQDGGDPPGYSFRCRYPRP